MKDPYSDLPYIHPLNKLPETPAMIGPSCAHCKGKHLGVDCIYRPKNSYNEKHDFNKFTSDADAKLINHLLREKSIIFFGKYEDHTFKNHIFINENIFINKSYKK